MAEDPGRHYTMQLSDEDAQVIRAGLQLLLGSEDDASEIGRIQDVLGRLPAADQQEQRRDTEGNLGAANPPWS